MKFNGKTDEYLQGISFSNGAEIPISEPEKAVADRFSLLENLVKGKAVLHIGCADHVALIDEKMKRDVWLHGRLLRSARNCVGIDINKEGIDYLRSKHGIRNLYHADICIDRIHEVEDNRWDYLILGEMLEHVNDPSSFLRVLHDRFRVNSARVVITVPNALSLLNIQKVLQGKEYINTDHRYWFTPYTLAKICISAGFKPEEFFFCEGYPLARNIAHYLKIMPLIRSCALRKNPALRETIVMTLSFI